MIPLISTIQGEGTPRRICGSLGDGEVHAQLVG